MRRNLKIGITLTVIDAIIFYSGGNPWGVIVIGIIAVFFLLNANN